MHGRRRTITGPQGTGLADRTESENAVAAGPVPAGDAPRRPVGPVAWRRERLRSSFINGIKRMPVRFTPERLRRSA